MIRSFIKQRCWRERGDQRPHRLRSLTGGVFYGGWPLWVLVVEAQRWFFKSLVPVRIRARIMTYIMSLFLVGLVLGLLAVASNPSPYFAAFGLVAAAGLGCGALLGHGGPFLSLVLFLIYLGGMLVVFAYSAALAAEPFPES